MLHFKPVAVTNEAPKTVIVGQNGRTIGAVYGNSKPPVFITEAQDIKFDATELLALQEVVSNPHGAIPFNSFAK